ncbi:MAG: hypothetical protein M0P91_01255 [Sulfuricurvum sp.]|uniref:hypothetical protein n=1 Tax=Sulfuricurvum sp. TaxID=2025608 RepID=UPI0025E0E961|nr:hypothetical protein [Sulfuricurvum sp.]MCK9371796.1 hypothetical protein [Sulfuricurvum sp.]
MNFQELSGKSVLLLGKTRSLKGSEFETLLKLHRIELTRKWDEKSALIIEGRLMNPLEQQESADLYERRAAKIVEINAVEEWLCRSIEPNRLLMSLKLSNDQERLVDFLQNPYLGDELFYKLLKLYDWETEGLFDNDRNRDVTASIIGRFYKDLARNHNVQYAMSGLAHLIERYGNRELIDAISELSPIQKELRTPGDRSLAGVLDAMAIHPETGERILRLLLPSRASVLAQRVPLSLENVLMGLQEEPVNRLLASNPSLSPEGGEVLEKQYPELIGAATVLDEGRFNRLIQEHAAALATNRSLSVSMQEELLQRGELEVHKGLAKNPCVEELLLKMLYEKGECPLELASNTSLPERFLRELYAQGGREILSMIALNPSAPVEILYQLSLDQRFERSVKTNPAYGKHIQTHNLGWQV